MDHCVVGPLQGHSGRSQEALVQHGEGVALIAGDGALHQADQLLVEGQQKHGAADVKEGVEGGDVAHIHDGGPEGQAAGGVVTSWAP